MELETNTPISDEARLLAQSKKLTLQPVHTNVAAEDLPDSIVVAQHINSGAVANIEADTEQNAASIVPADSSVDDISSTDKKSQVRIYTLTAIGILLLAAVITLVVIQL